MSKTVRRRGFTLPEVLVTITIVAVLAAVVVPAVLNQVSKGDNAALAGDVGALRTAISNFTTDTRNYPKYVGQLTSSISTADSNLTNATYSAAAVNSWKGPYFPTSQAVGTGTYATTAFSLTINSLLTLDNNFITLTFGGTGMTAANVATIDRLYDSGDGTVATYGATTNCTLAPASASAGQIVWTIGVPGGSPGSSTPCTIASLKSRLVSAAQ